MLIDLDDIPEEGRTFTVNDKSGDLDEALKDILRGRNYSSQFTLRPLANNEGTFELTGYFKAELPELCSRCGIDFNYPINELFRELLIPEQALPRDGKFAKTNHFTDFSNEGLSVVEYSGRYFNAGDYFHELIALATPFNPAPELDEQENCTVCKLSLRSQNFNYDDDFPSPESPFSVLKKLKLN